MDEFAIETLIRLSEDPGKQPAWSKSKDGTEFIMLDNKGVLYRFEYNSYHKRWHLHRWSRPRGLPEWAMK